MRVILRLVGLVVLLCAAVPAWASDATLLRLFLTDGTAFVSYGEFARVDDRVIFSMPVGGTLDQPRLHVVSIPAAVIDWPRTERYGASARYQHYAATRGDEDFARLSNDIARVLSAIGLTTEPARALEMAMRARTTMAGWPAAHYGYRQRDVGDIVALLDEVIANLRATAGVGAFDVTLVANVTKVPIEPLFGMPGPVESVHGIVRVAQVTDHPAERISLLQSALLLLEEAAAVIPKIQATLLSASIRGQIRDERAIDERYARFSRTLLARAEQAAAGARVRDVEAVLARVPVDDERLGRKRPDVVRALQLSIQAHLDGARKLRLLRDQWMVHRALFRDYQRSVGSQILQLVKTQPALDAIRRLDGPNPDTLSRFQNRLAGGAEQLQRMLPPMDLRPVHDMFVGAWRFAEQAIQERSSAVSSGNVGRAWEASSAAAAALMLLSNAQRELRSFLEPPRLR